MAGNDIISIVVVLLALYCIVRALPTLGRSIAGFVDALHEAKMRIDLRSRNAEMTCRRMEAELKLLAERKSELADWDASRPLH